MKAFYFIRTSPVIADWLLLLALIFTIFGVMLLPVSWFKPAYNLCYSAILITAFFCLPGFRVYTKWIIVAAVLIQWLYFFSDNQFMHGLSRFLNICLFSVISIWQIRQAMLSKRVTALVILQAVCGYLMMGILFSVMVGLVMMFDRDAYSFNLREANFFEWDTRFNEYIYYGFVTLTTVGYGDLVPVSSAARAVSILTGLCGQLYLTIVIAMLVGKYSGNQNL